jgi:predicted RNA binding protein YcfA (HicA-like mRNA interferase family)
MLTATIIVHTITESGQIIGNTGEHLGEGGSEGLPEVGWEIRGQVGSHLVMTKPGVRQNLTIPQHPELAPGTLRALIRTAGITVDEFLSLL